MGDTLDAYRGGKVHVLSRKCSTCIFRPGDLMRLGPERKAEVEQANLDLDSALVCHQTLPYGGHGAEHQAVCRGFFDVHKADTLSLRMAVMLDKIEHDDPPTGEEHL